MASNEERRRVAKELREAASAKGKRSGSMELMLSKLLGITKQDIGVFGQQVDVAATWRDVYRKLADLIEPQERTCHDARQRGGWFLCSRCGAFLADGAVTNATNAIRPRYCPNCGAEVVDE